MPRQVDRECRLVPEVAAVVTESQVCRDRPALPLDTREAQPAGVGSLPDQAPVELPVPLLEKETRPLGRLPTADVLRKEIIEVGKNVLCPAHLPHVDAFSSLEEPLMTQKALLVDRGVCGTCRGEVEKRRFDLPLVAKVHSESFCRFLEKSRSARPSRHEAKAKANEIFDLVTGGQQQRVEDLRTGNVSDEVEIVGAA